MSNSNEKYIGESLIREEPGKKLKLKIGDKVIKKKHLSDEVSEVFNDIDNLQNEIDSLEVAGIALSNDYGSNPLIGISQMKLTESYNEQTEKNAQYDETLEEHTTELENTYRKSETYSKGQIDEMYTTPDQHYESYSAEDGDALSDILPATGEAHTIYRVGNWDGTGYDEGGYTEYAWDGTQYVQLSVKQPGIDEVPAAGSNNIVKSGGVWLQGRFIPNESYQGYIENGVWKDVGTGVRTYKIIPFPFDCDTIRVKANNDGAAVIQCLSEYTPSEDSSTGILSNFSAISAGSTAALTVPSGTKYLYVLWVSGTNRAPASIFFDGQYMVEYDAFDLMAGVNDAVITLKMKHDALDTYFNRFVCKDYVFYSSTVPNVDIENNTLDLGENATFHLTTKNEVITLSSIFANNEYRSIPLVVGTNAWNAIMFDTVNHTFSATARDVQHTPDEILLGFYNYTAKVAYFNFNFTVGNLPQDVEIFDVSVYNSGAQYTSLADAIAAIPTFKRKGGMEIKFILKTNVGTEEDPSYTYKYVHYRYANMTTNGFTTTSNWIGLSDDIERRSPQIATSGGVFNYVESVKSSIIPMMSGDIVDELDFYNGNVINGQITYNTATRLLSNFVKVKDGISFAITNSSITPTLQVIVVGWANDTTTIVKTWFSGNAEVAVDPTYDYVTIGIRKTDNSNLTPSDINGIGIRISGNDNDVNDYVPKLGNLGRKYMSYGNASAQNPPVLTFIHYSDMHGYDDNFTRIKQFYDKYQTYINGGVLDTGDFTKGQFQDTLPDVFPDITNFMRVIGNHDTMNRVGDSAPYTWVLVDKLQCYNKMLAPYIGEWGVTQPADAATYGYCYWYKDYTENHVRLIALDCEHWQWNSSDVDKLAEAEAQRTWLVATLEGARQLGYHVVCAVHRQVANLTPQLDNPFDSYDFNNTSVYDLQPAYQAVQDFIDAEGNFVCWLSGHVHDDYFGTISVNGYTSQLIVGVACGGVAPSTPYSTMFRISGHECQDCFNVVGIDVTSKTLKIMRVGANYDRYMRRKNVLSWNYGTGTMIYVDR